MYSCDHNLIFKHFPLPKKKTCACSAVAPCFPCPPLATTNLQCTIKNITITQHCKAVTLHLTSTLLFNQALQIALQIYFFNAKKKVTLLSGKLLKNYFQLTYLHVRSYIFICFNQTTYESKLTPKHNMQIQVFFFKWSQMQKIFAQCKT